MASPRALLRYAASPEDLRAIAALRQRAFGHAAAPDDWDGRARHLMLCRGEDLIGTLRLTLWQGDEGQAGYTAQFYDLKRFFLKFSRSLEVGRFCLDPQLSDLFTLQQLLGGITRAAEEGGATALFGCASFPGSDPALHEPALAYLRQTALAPQDWAPGLRGGGAVALPQQPLGAAPVLPPLLRGYLALGARVSDHAVPDPALNTLHVFAALEPARIPPGRLKVLRALAE
ncbi:GNAT family N-acyltransferase [Falsigemmobacter faecalis]|uniref:L-ornithine N(alpha)-acyltransferase n=1 Tax=Falsigemmobacter faecalis TaxID=2488730 RepID=A0A3P3DQL0_9RHOB|nr:GNAT family N-acyltransferase [Falsigemmobacter faecalis]RRH75822.1 GNAT family N-acetyltransferase [Falsigemmobacter faecalis]